MSDLGRLSALKKEVEALEKLKEQIKKAMTKVSDFSISSERNDSMTSAYNTFNWAANNMDTYWDVTDSMVRNKVQESMRKVGKEFTSSGLINSCISDVMAKANEKLSEIDNEINSLNAEIAALESQLIN